MVSFQCESCGDVLTKKKLDPHRNRCRGATFSCIDCMVHFNGTEYRSHTSCMTEDQKYQGALYKNKNKKARLNPPADEGTLRAFQKSAVSDPAPIASASATPATKKPSMAAVAQHQPHLSHAAYVEDVPEDLEAYLVPDDDDNASRSSDDAPPHAPTPPPADGPVNVFDFLVASNTPNASNMELPAKLADSSEVVPYDFDVNKYLDGENSEQQLVQYEGGPVPVSAPFQTPAPGERTERRKKETGDKEVKKDKKRKRLYLDIHDQVMTDAPPVLHSGLTGGLNRLSTKQAVFPPSPESAETPASPLKKSKHSKHAKARSKSIGNNLFSMLTAASKPKTKKRKHRASPPATGKKHHHHRHRSDSSKTTGTNGSPQKLIEFPVEKKEGDENAGQMIVYKPRADLFLSFVNKGPDSERGCSMNKTLKRFHRERTSSGTGLSKQVEEKELFRSLRLRKNDRGEIVLFCVDE